MAVKNCSSIFFKIVFLFIQVVLFICVSAKGNIAVGKCLVGLDCLKCPKSYLEKGYNGQSLCCPGCLIPPIIGNSNHYCMCVQSEFGVEELPADSRLSSRIIFGGQTKRYPPSNQKMDYPTHVDYGAPKQIFDVDTLRDALSMMTDAIEKLDLRLRRVEETLEQGNPVKFVETPVTDNIFEESSPEHSLACKQNFVEVGSSCIFVSVFTNQRANWKDAHKECQFMGSVLAEAVDHKQYVALSSYLSETSTTAGYGYWLGGLYPGGIWIWLSNGQKVTLDNYYWTTPNGKPVALPGDTKNGRCLSFHFARSTSYYKLAADECGYEKYFICQTPKMR